MIKFNFRIPPSPLDSTIPSAYDSSNHSRNEIFVNLHTRITMKDSIDEMGVNISADRWGVMGDIYKPIGEGGRSPSVPPGVYALHVTPMGWFLQQKGSHYELPFKIYGTHDHIINRVSRAWSLKQGNLSVLFNGLKGTGKTVSAQLLSNWAVEQGMPVISITGFTPVIEDMLNQLKQPVLLLFDEFEKNFQTEDKGSVAQQKMLSIIDGLSRSSYRRLFLFTSNHKNLDENMIDRPSRIRYIFEFENLAGSVISELLDDILVEDAVQFKQSIIDYTKTLRVLSMDAVKVIAEEVNMFLEPPSEFKDILNLTEKQPWDYSIDLLDPETNSVIKRLKKKMYPSEFKYLDSYDARLVRGSEKENDGCILHLGDFMFYKKIDVNTYLVAMNVSREQTWMAQIKNEEVKKHAADRIKAWERLWKQTPGDNFSSVDDFNSWDPEKQMEFINRVADSESEFGHEGKNEIFAIRLSPNYEEPRYGGRAVSKNFSSIDF